VCFLLTCTVLAGQSAKVADELAAAETELESLQLAHGEELGRLKGEQEKEQGSLAAKLQALQAETEQRVQQLEQEVGQSWRLDPFCSGST